MRLLILGCSARKNQDLPLLPAIERYDGPAFRTLRAYLRTHPQADLAVLILSPRYGLIPADLAIPVYDERLTVDHATRLRRQVQHTLAEKREVMTRLGCSVSHTLVMLGATYQIALPRDDAWQEPLGTVT